MADEQHLIIKMVLDSWNTYISRTTLLFDSLSDEQLQREVVPGRNTGTYLLGHLAAVHDALFTLLGLGEKLYPGLEILFINKPDKSVNQKPAISELRKYWVEVNNRLSEHFKQLPVEEWFQKHVSVSEEDFKNEPHRNKLNVIINRANHLAYHLGQLAFLEK